MRKYLREAKDLHFDAVELPDACGGSLPEEDLLHLLHDVSQVWKIATKRPEMHPYLRDTTTNCARLRRLAA